MKHAADCLRIAFIVMPLGWGTACATADSSTDLNAIEAGDTDGERGSWEPGKSDGASCENACGGRAPGGCWCDDACVQWGDCCPDVVDHCEDGGDGDDDNNQGDEPDPEPDPEPEPEPEPEPDPNAVCFPGADNSWTTCLPTVSVGFPSGYSYPTPLGGNPNYRKPERFIDLDAVDPDTVLAPNFKLSEIAQSWKGRYAIVQPHAVERLQKMRDAAGALKVNSGFRSPKYNKSVGGAKHSRHMFGDAFDVDPVSTSVSSLASICIQQGGKAIEYATFLHCDWRSMSSNTTFFGGAGIAGPAFGFAVEQYSGTIVPDGDAYAVELAGFEEGEGEPVLRWTAYNDADEVIADGEGSRFVAPAQAHRVAVDVGRAIELELDLSDQVQ